MKFLKFIFRFWKRQEVEAKGRPLPEPPQRRVIHPGYLPPKKEDFKW
jgi:hypothetical protein